jgi:hypothetical protein
MSAPPGTFEERTQRLAAVRRKDSDERRFRVEQALRRLRRDGRRINRSVVAREAGVHRNFLQRHVDLGALVDEAARRQATATRPPAADRLSEESLRVDLVRTQRQNDDLRRRVKALEARLSVLGGANVDELLESHPAAIQLRSDIERLQFDLVEARGTIRDLREDNDALHDANAHLAKEIMLRAQA